MQTEFHDKSGKPLYVGDLIMWRLGKFAKKSGGPKYFYVKKNKKGVFLVPAESPESEFGFHIRKNQEEYITLIDTSERED